MHSATRLLPAFRSCCCDAVLAGCSSTVAARLGRATTVTAPGSTGRGTSTNSSYHRPAVYSRPLRPSTSDLAPGLSPSVPQSSYCLQPATTALDHRPGAGTQYLSPRTVYSRPLRPLTSGLVPALSQSRGRRSLGFASWTPFYCPSLA